MIAPAFNTDLGRKGLHDLAPPFSDVINAVFQQLKESKSELTFGFSETMAKQNPEEIKTIFNRINPI